MKSVSELDFATSYYLGGRGLNIFKSSHLFNVDTFSMKVCIAAFY